MNKSKNQDRAAVFLDRDGTIIEDRGDLSSPDQVLFFPETFPALRQLAARFPLFLVTNQGGVGRGALTMEDVNRVNSHVAETLRREGIDLVDIYVCPHLREDECQCCKPSPWFLQRAAAEYSLDLSKSFMVGDHPHDVLTGTAAGGTGIYLLTGHGLKHRHELTDEPRIVVADIGEAAKVIVDETEFQAGSRSGEVQMAAHLLRRGHLVAFPTETVYGLGGNAYDELAAARIFAVKGRPRFDPLIVHIPAVSWLDRLTMRIPPAARRLAEVFWPGPLTLVLQRRESIPDIVVAGLETVAVRVPEHPVALSLLEQTKVPLAAPSANVFAGVSPTRVEHVKDAFSGQVEMILDGGECRVGVESTIIGFDQRQPVLLRPGGVSVEAIEQVLRTRVRRLRSRGNGDDSIAAPGMLRRHYSPGKPIRLFANGEAIPPFFERHKAALLLTKERDEAERKGFMMVEKLSENGDCTEIARNLFAAMRRLQESQAVIIFAETAPDEGLGSAVNDRLQRAAAEEEPA